jgi:hypothetical protein
MDNIENYREPMVTATGIFLGFMLNYASGWITTAFTVHIVRDTIVGISIVLCITLLLVVLYRMLNMHYPTEQVDAYYQKTLRFLLIAASLPFIGFLLLVLRLIIVGSKPVLD